MNGQTRPYRNIWARGLALLGVLCVIQTALLVTFRDKLLVAHWWTAHEPRPAAFWCFVAMLAVNLLLVAHAGRRLPAPGARKVILLLFAACAAVALLSLQVLGKSYLQIWLAGELSLGDISSYLFLDFFDRKPWLVLYLLAFVAAYALARFRKREAWCLYALAAMAPVYVAFNHRSILDQRQVLTLLVILGVSGLAIFPLRRHAAQAAVIACVLVAGAVTAVIMAGAGARFGGMPGHLAVIVALSCLLLGVGWFGLVRWGCPPRVRALLPFLAMAFFFLLNNDTYAGYRHINRMVCYAFALGHYYWGHVLVTAIFLGIGLLLNRLAPRLVPALDVAAVLVITASYVDYRLMSILGARLDWDMLTMSDDTTLLFRTIAPYLNWKVFSAVGLGAILYAAGARLVARPRLFERLSHGALSSGWAYVAILLAATSHYRHSLVRQDQFGDSPVARILGSVPAVERFRYRAPSPEQFAAASKELGLPIMMRSSERLSGAAPASKPLNLVFILMESAASEYLSLFGAAEQTQPLLSAYADRMELFPNAFGAFPTSNHARFSSFSSLYGTRMYVTYVNPRISCKSIFEILHAHGYYNALFYSSFRDFSRLNDYLGHRKIDEFYDATDMPGAGPDSAVAWGVREETTLHAMTRFLRERAGRPEPFSMTYIPAAPHMPYDTRDERFNVFTEGFGPIDGNFVGRFKNTLLYMDWIFTCLIQALEAEELLDSTLVVMISDHGESLGRENGLVGHGRKLDPQLANLPLIVMNPERPGYKVNPVTGSHVDLLPTILDLLHVPLPDDELYQGVSLYSAAAGTVPIYLTSFGDRALVEDGRYVLETLATGGGAPVYRGYRIRNEGAATAFEPEGEIEGDAAREYKRRLDLFVSLQMSLIRFYDEYRDALLPGP